MPPKYNNIKLTGQTDEVSVKEARGTARSMDSWRVLIMGPTGSGKSSFVEALAGPSSPLTRISSNQLDSFTQQVAAYELTGARHSKDSGPIYLIDTPGFADAKISEMDIVLKVQKWMEQDGVRFFHRVLYLIPITSVRLPGSQRQVLDTFRALTGIVKTADQITLVTTMWDVSVHNERVQSRAESTYLQLKDDIWKDCVSRGSRVTKFHNNRESALEILDGTLADALSPFEFFPLEEKARGIGRPLRSMPFALNLYEDLTSRIMSLRLKRDDLQTELDDPDTKTNQPLTLFLEHQIKAIKEDLTHFEGQLAEFGPPPSPAVDRPSRSPSLASRSSGDSESETRGRWVRVLHSLRSLKCWGKTALSTYDS